MPYPLRPRVSVLMAVRDEARYGGEALASLLGQSLGDLEVVVVDDGSRDGTREVLEGVALGDSRVRIITTEPQGLVAALNRGLAECRAPLIARMDGDDLSCPGRLAAQEELLSREANLVAVGCLVEGLGDHGMDRYLDWLNGLVTPEQIEADLFVESPLAHPSVMMRADALMKVGAYRERGWPEDYDLWLRLWERGGRFAKVEQVGLLWRDHPHRLSRTHKSYSRAAFRELKLHVLLRTLLKGRRQVGLWGGGMTGKGWGRRLRARGMGLTFVVDIHPARVGRRVQGAAVIAPPDLPAPGEVYLVCAVAAPGARGEIRAFLHDRGYGEGRDYVVVA